MHFYGTGLAQSNSGVVGGGGAMPLDQALIPTAPLDSTDFAIGAGDHADHHHSPGPSAATTYDDPSPDAAAHKEAVSAPPPPADMPLSAPPQPPAPPVVVISVPVAALASPAYPMAYGEAPIPVAEVYIEEESKS